MVELLIILFTFGVFLQIGRMIGRYYYGSKAVIIKEVLLSTREKQTELKKGNPMPNFNALNSLLEANKERYINNQYLLFREIQANSFQDREVFIKWLNDNYTITKHK